ncbi:hypothetical protein CLOP_g14413 [Closterium sp. NIES-67]|nr:hypothetical protein CLOP_g14413 [Closterium sp. NIES-67]
MIPCWPVAKWAACHTSFLLIMTHLGTERVTHALRQCTTTSLRQLFRMALDGLRRTADLRSVYSTTAVMARRA